MAERRQAAADPLRAKVYADPKIRNPEGFLVWLGRRKGGLNSHRGRSSRPGPGTRKLALAGGGQTPDAHQPAESSPAARLVDAPTMRLSRADLARAAGETGTRRPAGRTETATRPPSRPAAPRQAPAVHRAPAREAETVRLHRPARDTPTVAVRRPTPPAPAASRPQPAEARVAVQKPPRPAGAEAPKPIDLPPHLAKLRVGNVKISGPESLGRRWKLGRRRGWSSIAKGL
ncbi:hypothetical protein CcI49_17155 [Frankia sp. CcI49]|nr:hypothetical protein CcI49_17155 [Frankia sp. CcI49]